MVSPRFASARCAPALLLLIAAMVIGVMALPASEPSAALVEQATVIEDWSVGLAVSAAEPERDAVASSDRLAVVVRDAHGEPARGVVVLFYREEMHGFPEDVRGETDVAGLFTSGALPAGSYRVRLEAGAETLGVELPMPAGTRLEFRLLPVR